MLLWISKVMDFQLPKDYCNYYEIFIEGLVGKKKRIVDNRSRKIFMSG